MSFLTEHAKNHPIVAGVSAQEPEPKGFFDTILSNVAGGAEGVIGGGLDYIGAQLNRLDEAGRASSYVDSIKDAKKGTLGKLGDSFINNGEYLNDKAAKNFAESGTLDKYQDMGILERLTSPEYLTNSRGLLADFSQMAGSAIPFAAASAVMPFGGAGAAAARGLGSMAARAGAKRIGSAIASKAGQQAGASAAKWGLGTGPLEAATNAGGMYADLKEQGLSDDEIARRMNSMIQEELPMDVVTQGIMGPILEGKGFKPIFNKGGRLGRAAGYSVNIPGSAGSEYMQEMTQQQAQNKWSGKEYGTFFHPTEDEQQAGRAAFMGALPLGVFGAGHTAYNNYKARLNRRNEEAAKSNPANPFAGMDDTVGDRTEIADVPASTVTVQNKDSGNSNDKEAFFRAIETQESGGNPDAVSSTGARGIYQIQPENWDAWAKEAGLAGASMDDDEAYRQVGRFKMGQYFDEYGPEGALVAWYSGPNNAQRWADGETTDQNGRPWDAPQGNGPSIADYVKSAMGHFADEQKQAPALEIPQAAEYTISGEVSNPNLTDLTEQKLRLLDRDYYNQFGRHFNITSMARNGGGESWHDSAQAFDAADDFLESNAEARSWLIDKAKEYGLYGLDEYSNPSANATGGHLHFSDHGEALQGSGSSSFTVPGVDMSRYNLTPEQEQENLEAAQALLANHEATPEQQQAVLDMAQQIMNTPVSEDIGEDAAHAVAMQEAIQNGDLQAIFRMHPQETANAIQNAGRPSPKKAPAVPQIESVKPQAATKPHIAQESVNRFAQTVDRITKLAAQGRIAEAALTARSSGMNNTMVNLLAQGVNASAGNVQNAIMNGIQLDVPTAFPALPAGRGMAENTQSSQQAKQPETLSEAITAIASSNPKAGAELANQNNMPNTASLIMGSAMNNQPLDNQAVNSAMNTDFENRRVQASRDRQALEERMRQAGLVRPNTAPDAGILVPNGAAAGTPDILVPDVRRPKGKTPTVNTNDAMAKLSDSPIFRQAKARGDIGAMASEADAMGFHKEAEQIRANYGNAPARFDFAKRLSEVEKMSREERRALGRDHIEEMEAKNIPINDKLRRDLENGVPKAIVSAEKKIAKAEPEEAEQEASQQEPLEPAEEKAEPAEPVNAGNKKAAKDGGYELADGYRTESGKPLAEADAREFILKPDGGKDFGEISQDISEAVKEQSGAELKPGKIRLRVGNETQGLIHAKKHEQQAKDDGYASIEDMIADVASGFDEIYLRTPKKEGDQPTYSLVKHGNKSVGKMNGTAPVYFDLQNDGKGQYYIVITAIPTGDKSLKRQTKKDRLIYSSPGLDTAAASNSSAVSRSVSNDVGAEQNVLPASDKSNGSSVSSVAQEEKSDNSTEKKIIGKTESAQPAELSATERSDNDRLKKSETKHFESADYKHSKTGELIPSAKLKGSVDKETYQKISALAKTHGGYYSRFAKRFFFKDTGADGRNAFVKEAEQGVFGGENASSVVYQKELNDTYTYDDAKKESKDIKDAFKQKRKEAYHAYKEGLITYEEARDQYIQLKKEIEDTDFPLYASKIRMLQDMDWALEQLEEKHRKRQQQAEPAKKETNAEPQTENKANTVKALYSDKSGSMKGGVADGVMTIWQKPGGIPKKEMSFTVALDELDKALKTGGANSSYTIHELAQKKLRAAIEAWIEGAETKAMRDKRRDLWENDTETGKLSAAQSRAEDSATNVIKNLYEQATGHKPQSTFEKAEEKNISKGKETGKADTSIFGSQEEADAELLAELGINPDEVLPDNVPEGIEGTEEERARLEAEIRKELNKISANPIFNPRLYMLSAKYVFNYMKSGLNDIKKLMTALKTKFGNDFAKDWAPAVIETIRTYPKDIPFNESHVLAVIKAVGTRYEKGMTSLDEIQKDMAELLKDQHKTFAPVIEASYNGVRKFFEMKEAQNHVTNSTDGLAARTSERPDRNAVGKDDAGRVPAGRDGQSISSAGTEVRPHSDLRLSDRGAAAGGKAGNRSVQAGKSEDSAGRSGSAGLSRSVRDSLEGDGTAAAQQPADRSGYRAAANGRDDAAAEQVNTPKPKAGSLEAKVDKALPMLLPEQRQDVVKAERQMLEKGSNGFLFTNGTGTGKTYVGMGLVKRMADSGKKNIMVVVPGDTIGRQWAEAAKKDFGIDAHFLENTKDKGQGVTVTTYANFGKNQALIQRDWDMVIADESQNLMSGKEGNVTNALKNLRTLTYHVTNLSDRYDRLHADELQKVHDDASLLDAYRSAKEKQLAEWKAMQPKDKPRVVFLSATPFPYVKDVDYAEGYLFDYDRSKDNNGGYNQPKAYSDFFIKHFGYRMRNGKLTQPDGKVDNRVMETQFHNWLRDKGVLSGRSIKVDKDYDRGWLLTPSAIGKSIDHGFEVLHNDKYAELEAFLRNAFDKRKKNYLLEYIKAREAVPVIKQYLQQGKKIVVFHQSVKEQDVVNPFDVEKMSLDTLEKKNPGLVAEIRRQYRAFQKECPELFDGSLEKLKSPVETLQAAFGDKLSLFNGKIPKKQRNANKNDFNDDNGRARVLVVQQDAGNAGISLHDTSGKFPRVLINLSVPTRPTYAMQIEGRIYRVGVQSNATFRYLTTGTNMEKHLFASEVGARASTAENLAMGDEARNLVESFRDGYMETMDGSWKRRLPGHAEEGTGGKAADYARESALSEMERAKAFYYARQKKTSRSKSAEGNDYFATPEPVGLKMVEWARAKDGDYMLEPSAGHGAISRWFSPNTQNIIIEPSGNLAPEAQMITPDAKLIENTFENHNIVNKYDGIVMNPPFGHGGKTAIAHVAKAYRHLWDGGRLVALIPEGPSADRYLNIWLNGATDAEGKVLRKPERGAVVLADVKLPAVTFERAGTRVGTHILVIDKYAADEEQARAHYGAQRQYDLRGVKDINELFDRLEPIEMPERYANVKEGEKKYSVSANNSVDNSDNMSHNVLSDRQKATIYNQIAPRIDSHIKEQIQSGKNAEEVLKELVSENSRHRAKLIGNYRASYRDLLNHVNDEPYKLQLVKQRTHNDNISQSVANATYDKMLSCLKEAVDYAGVIYREVALDRRGNHGHGDRLHDWVSAERDRVHDWVSAERQRAERESRNRNSKITGSRSDKDGFSNAWKLSASEARAQKAQAMEKLRHDIAEALPNAKNIRDEGSSIFFTMPNRAEVEIHIADELTVRGAEADKARQAHGIGRGVTIKVNGTERTMGSKAVIQLSKTGDDGSVHHEVFHAVWDMVLTPKEKGAITRAYQEEATRAGKDVIEVAADKYRDWFLAKEKGQAKAADGKPFKFGLLWRKIRAAVEKLRSVIAGSEEVNRIFRDIESGRVWERNLDNSNNKGNNGAKERQFIDSYLAEKLTDAERQTVAAKVKAGIDNRLEAMKQGDVAEERDNIPFFKRLRTTYHNAGKLKTLSEDIDGLRDKAALLYGYGRRCFDNDTRIEELINEQNVSGRQQRGIYRGGETAVAGNSNRNIAGNGRRSVLGRGIVNNAGSNDVMEHFQKIIDSAYNSRNTESRSNQNGFSSAPKFAARSLDNSQAENDNIANKVFDRYLNDGIMKMVKDTVAKEIGEHVNLADMGDAVARDEARDSLPCIKKMLTWYNKKQIQDNPAYKDRLAVRIEYARRCFDNDERIKSQYRDVRPSDGNDRQGRSDSVGNEIISRHDGSGNNGNRGRGTFGVSRSVSGGKYGARAHFEKLFEEESRSSKDGFSSARKFSISEMQTETEPAGAPNRIKKAMRELGKIVTEDNVEVREKKASKIDNLNMLDMWAKSVRQVSRKNNAVKYFYNLARKAYDEQENLRSHFGEAMKRFNNYTKDEKDLADVSDVLLQGDMEGREYKAKELKEMGLSDNAIRAYKLVRLRLGMAYKLVNDARMQVTERNKIIPRTQLAEFKKAHFLTDDKILSILNKGDGKILVTYRGAKVYEHKDELLSAEAFKNLRRDKDACILHFSPEVDDLGDVSYRVDYTERIKPVTKLTGYVPHFFHKFMVYQKYTDASGEEKLVTLGSGRSMKEAADLANRIAREHPEQDFVIRPQSFEMGDEYNNVIVGDRDYAKMTSQIHKHTDMSLADARKFLRESAGVSMKGRHRFFGNLQKRKGAQGFETDVPWVLEHYFNAASRYTAMEKWKPQAISTYERWFGDFNAEPKTDIARYIKNHINDMNGVPSRFEKLLNKTLEKTALGRRISDYYNGRPALALSGSISAFNAVTKLGLGNFASAVTNFMQFINIGTRLNSYTWAMKGLQKALHPTKLDKRILKASGVLNDISLADNNGGYSRSRDSGRVRDTLGKIKRAADMTMLPFTAADTLMRKAAVLGAYYQGVAEQGMRPEKGKSISKMALQYAKDVNFDANFDYSTVSTPGAIRAGSVLTQQMFQFQKYPIMQFEFMWNHVVHAKDNAQRARFLVPYLLLAGAAGALPFGDLLNDFLSFVVGTFTGKDENLAEDMKAEMMKWAGSDPASKKLVESVIYGLPALAGIDISGRVGMSGAFSGKYYGAAPTSSAGAIANALGGPALGSAFNAIDQIHNNNPAEALKAISPALGNMAQAWVTGASYGKHHRVNTVYEDTYAKFIHGLGFRSTDESNTSFINSYLYNMRSRTADERKDAMDAYRREKTAENKRRMQDLGITDKQFQKYESDAKKSSQERALTENTKRKKKTPETEAEQDTKALKDFMR